MAVRHYLGIARPAPEGGLVCVFPDLPGFFVSGPDADTIATVAKEQMPLHFAKLAAQGSPIPLPRTHELLAPQKLENETRFLVPADRPNESPKATILANAQRLLADANLMAVYGSFATSVFLSISAIEEVGKLIIILSDPDAAQRKINHVEKQRVLGGYLDRLFFYEALEKHATDAAEYFRKSGQDQLAVDLEALPRHEQLNLLHAIFSEEKERLIRTIREAAGPEEIGINYSNDVRGKRVLDTREHAIYVDLRDGKVVSPSPFDVRLDDVDMWLERARFAVHLAARELHQATPAS